MMAVLSSNRCKIVLSFLLLGLFASSSASGATTTTIEADTGRGQECIAETTELLDNQEIISAYESIAISNSNEHEVDGDETVKLQYGPPDDDDDDPMTIAYKDACETHGGVYRSLDFMATCLLIDDTTDAPIQTDNLQVSDFPRCYGTSCQESDEHHLFQQYTLRPTEELNAMHGTSYMTCSGSMTSVNAAQSENTNVAVNYDEEACLQETRALMEMHAGLSKRVYAALQPTHNTTSFRKANMATATLHELKYTTALSESLLQEECESSGGVYYEIVFVNQCGRDITYTAANVPRCGGPSCKPGEFDFDKVAELVLLHAGTLKPGQSVMDGCPTKTSSFSISAAVKNSHLLFILIGVFAPLVLAGVGFAVLIMVRNKQQKRHVEIVSAETLSKDFEGSVDLKDACMLS